ncbi:Mrp/NBP35 family ATP-binding protein [Kaistia nematophila]|uniref:Iron-sulfur cluster carrier protein n=1 Tax=Kaistia nematophila TaxID=2994654 RepID=A0A9X3IMF1_9HYPH|nr:Mrp/NBP35 family ATP-binding protein [Kaistia nematophila]MBN9027438.1 Mrp/NBP35 family ATP-binding protein [Hyphomicrobiales bacterium]MCX5570486.1 Mrp/NBP35 family ATP-binding protein [Kaistia nematophila]
MTALDQNAILERLRSVEGPDGKGDIVSLGLVSDILIHGGKVMFSITVDAARANALEPLREKAAAAVRGLDGVESALVILTAERRGNSLATNTPPPRPAPSASSPAAHPPRPAPARPSASGKPGIPGVTAIIAVASGKGGVGKSTTAVNIALGLAANGLKVGLLDADIYGPSVPRLLGLSGRPEAIEGRTLKPMEAYGIKAMSMGFLVEEETPMIWRGPMVMSAITQMLREVAWAPLDILVVDMPPGTGDAQLTMAQQVPLAGAVIVSTPQDLALIDARKGLAMFKKVDVPLLGIVENMSYFIAPDTGARYDIFGHGGAKREAERLGVPFLGEVPLEMVIRETSDSGKPVTATAPDGPHARVYKDIAAKIWATVSGGTGARPAPQIVIE